MFDQISLIAAIAVLHTVDFAIERMAFPAQYTHKTQKVEYDYFEQGTTIALKGNFARESKIIPKAGFTTYTVNPMHINLKITDAVINSGGKRIGETIYGADAASQMSEAEKLEIEDMMKGFGALKTPADVLRKKSMYDVLTTGKLVVSGYGEVDDEIDYVMTNKVVNDNATAGSYQWNDTTNSDPVEQLELLSTGMGQFAFDTAVLGSEARKAWAAHPKVLTMDNTTTGKRKNFNPATPEEKAAKGSEFMDYLGETSGDKGRAIAVYAERETYIDAITLVETAYLNKNYVVCFKLGAMDNAQVHYGMIPVAEGAGTDVRLSQFEGKEWAWGKVEEDPAGVTRYYRTSPLFTLNKPKAFASIKATLIA